MLLRQLDTAQLLAVSIVLPPTATWKMSRGSVSKTAKSAMSGNIIMESAVPMVKILKGGPRSICADPFNQNFGVKK